VEAELQKKLGALALEPPKAQPSSPVAARISGKAFSIRKSEACPQSVNLDFSHQGCLFKAKDDKGEHSVHCGLEKWVDGETAMPGTPPKLTQGKLPPVSKVAASGTWKDANTFEMTWRYYETPHHDTVTCRFAGETIRVEFMDSMTQMSPGRKDKRPAWEGDLVA
ncbi:MAG TPA: serine hydrolase, partial [Verrucomicrobiae bacterium]